MLGERERDAGLVLDARGPGDGFMCHNTDISGVTMQMFTARIDGAVMS